LFLNLVKSKPTQFKTMQNDEKKEQRKVKELNVVFPWFMFLIVVINSNDSEVF